MESNWGTRGQGWERFSTPFLVYLNILPPACIMCVLSHTVMSTSLQPHGLQPSRLLCPQDFPGKSAGMGCHFLLQRIFPTQGLNPGLPQCRQTLYRLSHQGNPWLGTITNVCFVCLVEDFGLGFLFFSHSPQIMTVA